MPLDIPTAIDVSSLFHTAVSVVVGGLVWSLQRNIKSLDKSIQALVETQLTHSKDISELRERMAVAEDRNNRPDRRKRT